jgi:GT2 family glycosyltransferase
MASAHRTLDMHALTIAVCTRDRPADLERCVRSVAAAESPDSTGAVEILIIDDGRLPETMVRQLRQMVTNRGHLFNYVRHEGQLGLIRGRLTAFRHAVADVVLFLDDDVEIDPDYLKLLVRWYRAHPEIVGLGGVDILTRRLPALKRLFARVFLLDSGFPGKLSPSGFSGSMVRWTSQRGPFRTDFLSGCNMSFRRQALRAVKHLPWLEGYSLGEDLYLSVVAAAHGPLWIDPALRVRHHRSSASRTTDRVLSYVTVVNPYHLLQVRKAKRSSYVALAWTAIGLMLKDAIRPSRWRVLPGYLAGLRTIVRGLLSVHAL